MATSVDDLKTAFDNYNQAVLAGLDDIKSKLPAGVDLSGVQADIAAAGEAFAAKLADVESAEGGAPAPSP